MAPPKTRPRPADAEADERGKRIDGLVQKKGWSNKEFARQLQIAETTAYKLRFGETSPRKETLARICKLFGVTESWILWGPPNPKQPVPGAQATNVVVPIRGTAGHPGVNDWLRNTREGKSATKEERDWMRGCPWPEDMRRAPEESYLLALQAFRTMRDGQQG